MSEIQELRKELDELKFQLERTRAYNECMNTIDKYTYYFVAGCMQEIFDLFAKRDDSSVEMAWGTYVGEAGLRACYLGFHTDGQPVRNIPGLLTIHTMITPVIEVAGDGKTARGVFFSPGIETMVREETGKPDCKWCWIKYGADFIKEDGKWYLWHLSTFGTFMCDFYTSWGDASLSSGPAMDLEKLWAELPEEWLPTEPITHADWTYKVDEMPPLDLVPPEPYETFDDVGYNICCPTAVTKKKD